MIFIWSHLVKMHMHTDIHIHRYIQILEDNGDNGDNVSIFVTQKI